jgi:phosphoribosylformylglycinamidine synthase
MSDVNVLVLRAAGINCEEETAFAWSRAGATPETIHINQLIAQPQRLERVDIVTVPGGFSYGDDIASGKILGARIKHHLDAPLRAFVARGGLMLGICNGFQVLVKAGLLPGGALEKKVTVTHNDSDRYEARWVWLNVSSDRCAFLTGGARFRLPVAHGEGKVIADGPESLARLARDGHVALRYCDADGHPGPFPVNPNGSEDDIAGLTDSTGRILGLMPHPERAIEPTQVPDWTRSRPETGPGMCIFENAVAHVRGAMTV